MRVQPPFLLFCHRQQKQKGIVGKLNNDRLRNKHTRPIALMVYGAMQLCLSYLCTMKLSKYPLKQYKAYGKYKPNKCVDNHTT